MNLTLFIQSGTNGAVTNAPVTSEIIAAEINLFDLALKGGWIMIPIGLLLFISLAVLIERLLVINKAGKEDATFISLYLYLYLVILITAHLTRSGRMSR